MALLGPWILCTTAALTIISAVIYYYLTSNHNYWKKRNIPYIKPTFPFGNFSKLFTGKATLSQLYDDFYPVFKDKGYGGVFNLRQPIFIVCKPELMKQFLTKDFSSFHNRGFPYDEENDPISANLFNLEGARWKALRAKLSPTFTSGKIKGMFPLIQECGDELRDCLQEEANKNSSVEMKDLLTRFTTDVIATCAFGVQCKSLKNPESEFYLISKDVAKSMKSFRSLIRFILMSTFPSMAKRVKVSAILSKLSSFFFELMERTVKYRKENNVQRNDFVQLMMKIMEEDSGDITFDQKIMTAQAFLFFLAGLDNVSNNIGFCLHAMAIDPDLQEKVHEEIATVLAKYDEKVSYEALGKMDLVSRVVDEGLRKYTPAGILIRVQTDDKYLVPGTDIVLEKGTQVIMPIQSVHMSEEYFPNPEKFDPDRFTEEEKSKRHPYAYIPFGEGPRFCIASRFAQLEMRLCLAELLRNFRFSVAPETDVKMELDMGSLGTAPKHKFWLNVTERKMGEDSRSHP